MFLASSYWRGSLNVKSMRLFNTLDEAVNYIISLDGGSVTFCRIYELSDNGPPILKTSNKEVIKKIEDAWGINEQ